MKSNTEDMPLKKMDDLFGSDEPKPEKKRKGVVTSPFVFGVEYFDKEKDFEEGNYDDNEELILLKKLRGHLAYKKQVKPYVIFRDKELFSLIMCRPKTLDELAFIPGFPRDGSRLNKWGDAIIAIFNRGSEIEDFKISSDENGEDKIELVLKKMEMF